MSRKIRIEQPSEISVKLFLYSFDSSGTPDEEGYTLSEESPRAYEVAITDAGLYGTFYAVVKQEIDDEWVDIDSGYISLGVADGTYLLLNKPPEVTVTVPSPVDPTYSSYGPKRVRTKEMEIEQFSPEVIQKAERLTPGSLPTFCSGPDCTGRNRRCYED